MLLNKPHKSRLLKATLASLKIYNAASKVIEWVVRFVVRLTHSSDVDENDSDFCGDASGDY